MARRPADVVRSPKIATRRRQVRRANQRRRRRVTFSVVALIVLSIGGTILARSSLFALEGIEVVGATSLTTAEVLQASGLHEGQSMLGLHADRVRARIARLALVRSVKVERVPTSRIRITIVERTPEFVLETAEARWNMDPDGVLLDQVDVADPSLPSFRLSGVLGADTGDRIRTPALDQSMVLWRALPSTLRKGAVTIDATSMANLKILRRGVEIRFGTADRLAQKLEAVRLVLDRMRRAGRTVVMLDVRSPGRPAARLG
jgi:cell division protein FtsQ